MPGTLHSHSYAALVDVLVSVRRERRLTQQQVADELGQPQSYVAKIEGGERRLDVLEFIDLCRAMGASPAKIFAKALAAIDRSN